jgi:diadenosine tetraphosphate (Ap4A) HIT family hydrolase
MQRQKKVEITVNQDNCIFCKIIARQAPAKVIAENDEMIVIDNIAPKAPIHYLIISKKHIPDIVALEEDDKLLAGEMLLMAKKLSFQLSGSQAFRLIVNNGVDVGQSVFHLHIHFLAGKLLFDY